MSNYKYKYLKYKSKYLQLKKQLGGEGEYTEIPELSISVPSSFIDNVFDSELFIDPVVATDGFTYERKSITEWFQKHNTSPTTGEILSNKSLIPNNTLKRAINEMRALKVIVSKSFLCPITGELYKNPVITADGETYEEAAIVDWFKNGNNTSPYTGKVLPNNNLLLNQTIKSSINEIRIEIGKSGKNTSVEYDDVYTDDGYNWFGKNNGGFFRDGFNIKGYNRNGFNKDGIHMNGTMFDDKGYDINRFNRDGIHINGNRFYDECYGFNEDGLFIPPKCLVTLEEPNHIFSVALHRDKPLFLTGSEDIAKLWSFLPNGTVVNSTSTMTVDKFERSSILRYSLNQRLMNKIVAFHPTLPFFATVYGKCAKLWHFSPENIVTSLGILYDDFELDDERRSYEDRDTDILDIKFHPTKKILATASTDFTAKLWNFQGSRLECFEILRHENWVRCVEFHPTLELLVTTSDDSTAKLWKISPYDISCMSTLIGHNSWVHKAVFHPSRPLLATVSYDGRLKLWSFSPDGSNANCEKTVWGDGDGDVDEDDEILEGRERFNDLAFHRLLPLLVTGGMDNIVKIWKLTPKDVKPDLTCIATMNEHKDGVEYVTFHERLSLIITNSFDRILKLWHFSSDGSRVNCVATIEGGEKIDVHKTLPFLVCKNHKTIKLWKF
jgi:WD40 repeat protein